MTIAAGPPDPRWHRLLGLAVHEFRTPVTVVSGYIRMLLTGRAGELTEKQRRLLEEAEKSCGRLSGLIAEMSELSTLEAGSATFNRSTVDVISLLEEAIAGLPALPDREVAVTLANGTGDTAPVQGDPTRLRTAFSAVLSALRRELVTSTELLVRVGRGTVQDRPVVRISVGDADHIEAVERADLESLGIFNEWRGGCGLSLAVARRIITGHEGWLWSPGDEPKSAAVLVLPAAT